MHRCDMFSGFHTYQPLGLKYTNSSILFNLLHVNAVGPAWAELHPIEEACIPVGSRGWDTCPLPPGVMAATGQLVQRMSQLALVG